MYSSASNYIDNTGIINVTLADNPVKDTQKVSNMKLVTPIRELRTASGRYDVYNDDFIRKDNIRINLNVHSNLFLMRIKG